MQSKNNIKIGIITDYYESTNYGGVLQAYALAKKITDMACVCKQICYNNKSVQPKGKKDIIMIVKYPLKSCKSVIKKIYKKSLQKRLLKRKKAFIELREGIEHTERVYTKQDLDDCLEHFDIFITGSDQVWNMDWYCKEYFLDFVPDSKRKVSYSASMPNIDLSDEQKNIVCEHLKAFDDISVREKDTAVFLQELTGRNVKWVLDPTLLLTREDWDKTCAERVEKEKYIFCYFLGTEKLHRDNAKKFARKMGYKIVTLPHLAKVNINDVAFGDIKLYDISPEQFISLIKYAEYVVTDSFHATVFSNIYQTKYFVFDRIGSGEMSSRIKSLVSLTGEEFRFCTEEKLNVQYMLTQKDISVPQMSEEILKLKEKSLEFLKKNLA